MDIQERFSVVLKVSKVVKWSRIFVRSIRGLPNFFAIPIMNPLTRVHDMIDLFPSKQENKKNMEVLKIGQMFASGFKIPWHNYKQY